MPPGKQAISEKDKAKTGLTGTFEQKYGKLDKKTYLGKDKYGNQIWRFRYLLRGTTRGTAGFTQKTLAVRSVGTQWQFGPPNNAAWSQPISGQDDVQFRGGDTALIQQATAKIGELLARGAISDFEAKTLISNLPTMSNSSLATLINRGGAFFSGGAMSEVDAPQEDFLGDDFWGGGEGGGGGGFAGPTYRAPDRRVVEDFVKGSLVSLVGEVPDHLVGPTVDLYMSDHRRNFDSVSAEVDPQQSVLERIRNTREYQTIHKMRPESEDERGWIASRQSAGQQGGLSQRRSQQFAIDQATVGSDLDDVQQAGAIAEFQATGQAPTFLDQQFRQAARGMLRGVVR